MELNATSSSTDSWVRLTQRVEATLNRVGTCLAWQWMCPESCDYVLGICADRADITRRAVRHLQQHEAAQ